MLRKPRWKSCRRIRQGFGHRGTGREDARLRRRLPDDVRSSRAAPTRGRISARLDLIGTRGKPRSHQAAAVFPLCGCLASGRAQALGLASSEGMAGAVPGRVTEMPATAEPKRTASTGAVPRDRAAAKPPLKASLAPVVSITSPALKAGTSTDSFLVWYSAPCEPSVMIAVLTPSPGACPPQRGLRRPSSPAGRSGFPLRSHSA